jgi:hypothetical protein
VRVDGTAYSILGRAIYNFATQPNISDAGVSNRVLTPTQVTLTAQAGPMQINVSFLNPVEVRLEIIQFIESRPTHPIQPGDWVRQSIPFSYLSIAAKSLDGSAHKMEVYSDFGPCM